MEEQEKIPASESNPTEGNQQEVNPSDLDDGQQAQGDNPTQTGEGEKPQENQPNTQQTNPNPPKQSRQTDALYAEERRRKKAREEAERKAREEEIRRQAVFEVKSGQVTSEELGELGLPKVANEDQLFLVDQLRKAKAEGSENPVAKAYQELYKKQETDRADAKAKTEAEEAEKLQRQKVVAEDQKNFLAKFGRTTADVMKNDTEFMEIFGAGIYEDKGNFTFLYNAYLTMKKKIEEAAKKQGAFPTTQRGPQQNNGDNESDEDFKKRWEAQHGHW